MRLALAVSVWELFGLLGATAHELSHGNDHVGRWLLAGLVVLGPRLAWRVVEVRRRAARA
jgi:hypothetical protein